MTLSLNDDILPRRETLNLRIPALERQLIVQAAESIGIHELRVHAIPDDARAFWLRFGLDESPLDPITLMTTVADLKVTPED